MGKRRRTFTDKFKAQVAIEAVKGIRTLGELASEYKVHPNQISDWKRQLLTNARELFASGKKTRGKTDEELTAPLYEEIRAKQGQYPVFSYQRPIGCPSARSVIFSKSQCVSTHK